MQDNYVYMQDNYAYMQDKYVVHGKYRVDQTHLRLDHIS